MAGAGLRRRTGWQRRRRTPPVRPAASAAPGMAERAVVEVRASAGLRQRTRTADRTLYDRLAATQHHLATHRKGSTGASSGSVSGLDVLSGAIPRPQTLLANVLRKRMSKARVLSEFWQFLRQERKYWLAPIVVMFILFGLLIVFSQSSAIAPFIYTLF